MKILITGGSGFIGTHLMDKILKEKYDILNFDKKESSIFPEKTIVGDIRDFNILKIESIDSHNEGLINVNSCCSRLILHNSFTILLNAC